MFARRELLLLVAWVGLFAVFGWTAQVAIPDAGDSSTTIGATSDHAGQLPAVRATNSGDHSPLLPRVVSAPLASAAIGTALSRRAKLPVSLHSDLFLPQSLQRQRVRWQI